MPQHIDHPAPRDLPLQAGEELLPRHALLVLVIRDAQLRPFLRLRGDEKGKELPRIHGELAVIRRIISREPTAAALGRRSLGHNTRRAGGQAIRPGHVAHDQAFESFFGGVGFQAQSDYVCRLEILAKDVAPRPLHL